MSTGGSRSIKTKKSIDPLQKKIPQNPRYQHVQATIDSGASLSKYLRKIEEIKQNYKFRSDEIFRRMKVTTFVQLLIQVHRLSQPDDYDALLSPGNERPDTADMEVARVQNGGSGSPAPSLALTDTDFGGRGEPESSRSTLLSVTRGIGELDINQPGPGSPVKPVDDTSPYLVLDIRDRDEYDGCRIICALSYPKAILSRAMNYESKEMLAYKNKEGKVILIYDDDERLAAMAATTLVQRGYDNIFMLSGGLKMALKVFPEGLLTGTPPFALTGVKPKSVKPASQTCFTNEDINKLEIYLDNALQDKNISSFSRLSKASSVGSSRMSSVRSSSVSTPASKATSSAITDRPTFRP
jgi:centrosomal protein CEP41